MDIEHCKYFPILSISPSEMKALKELPEKTKDGLIPIFPLKRWLGSNHFENTLMRIEDSFENRQWIADIDSNFYNKAKDFDSENYPKPVYKEIMELVSPNNGYANWYAFFKKNRNVIPSLIMGDLSQVREQFEKLQSLKRGVAIKFNFDELNEREFETRFSTLLECNIAQAIFILDFGDIGPGYLSNINAYYGIVKKINTAFKNSKIIVSSTSFPYSFSGQNHGEASIYERQLFQKLTNDLRSEVLRYSDHGSARAQKAGGGSGVPPPRIDYSLKLEWQFIREEIDDDSDEDKEYLYKKIAIDMMNQDYWLKDLKLWGTQMIELTSKGDTFGITSARDSTAVRINLHLYQQLNYDIELDELDTDEDWTD